MSMPVIPLHSSGLNIFEYHDFREFIKDWLSLQTQAQPDYSMRKLCKHAGLTPSLLTMILNEASTMTLKTAKKIAPALSLNPEQTQYFHLLVKLSDSETQEEKEQAFEQMKAIGDYRKANPDEIKTHEYLKSWIYPAIRELAQLDNFQFDPWWIKSKLKIKASIGDIRDGMYFLLQNGFLKQSKKGKITRPDQAIHCKSGIYRLSIAEYYRQTLSLAGEAPYNSKREERKMSGHTVALAAEDVENVRQIIAEAEQKIIDLTKKTKKAAGVYQIALLAFPLTNKEEEAGE